MAIGGPRLILASLGPPSSHPHGLPDPEFDALFTADKPVIFAHQPDGHFRQGAPVPSPRPEGTDRARIGHNEPHTGALIRIPPQSVRRFSGSVLG